MTTPYGVLLPLLLGITYIGAYEIGAGISDVTGPVADIPFMGYTNIFQTGHGLHLRQYARAFIIKDTKKSLVFVVVDTSMIGYALRNEVLKRLKKEYSDTYDEQNVIISGTHTHSGPGGFLMDFVFDIMCFGYIKETFESLASGITQAIVNAHNSLKKGKIYLNSGELLGVNINRSPTAYMLNSEEERSQYKYDVDKEMTQLKLVSMDNQTIGVLNWYAIHATSMNSTNHLVSSDNVGYASILFEEYINNGSFPGTGPFVAAFAVTNQGDTSPNVNGGICIDNGNPCEEETSACDGSSTLCRGVGPGKDQFENTKIIANALFEKAKELWADPGAKEIVGEIITGHQFVDIQNTTTEYIRPDGSPMLVKGCSPAIGYSFAAGTIDGPGISSFIQGTRDDDPFWNALRDLISVPTQEDVECHYPKPILLATGRAKFPYTWQSSIVSIQVSMIGDFMLVAVPAEFTTMAGRRLQESIRETLHKEGTNNSLKIVIGGLSNAYSNYVATPEEYEHQRYEGASTVFGPYTLNLYLKLYGELVSNLIQGKEVKQGQPPADLTDLTISLIPPIITDSPGSAHEFGDCTLQPPLVAKGGTTISVEFVSAHPKNNVKSGNTFVTVERLDKNKIWTVVATDASWETKFFWRRTLILEGMSEAIVQWDIPFDIKAGLYRIKHFGYYKLLQSGVHPYSGSSRMFLAIPGAA